MPSEYKIIDVTKPRQGWVVLMNAWWECIEGKPEMALFYGNSPQCNSSETIMKKLAKDSSNSNFRKLRGITQDISVIHIPIAYVPPIND